MKKSVVAFGLLIPILTLSSISCVSTHVPTSSQMPDVKEFEVPTDLATKFEVKEEKPVAVAPESTVVAPHPQEKVTKAKKKEKKAVEVKHRGEDKLFASRWIMEPFLRIGERYVFDITYFGATAGELVLQVQPNKIVSERPVYHLRAEARTASVFSLFYRMNDVGESFMDTTGLFSHKFTLKLDESLQQRELLELYDQRKNTVFYWSKLDHKKKGKKNDQFEIPVKPFTQDGLSAFFYVRTLPLEVGKEYEFPVVTNGKMRDVKLTVLRKEVLKTRIGEIPALVIKPEVSLDGVLKTYGDSFLWVSDDAQRRILKVDAKIKIGSVIAYLREYSDGQGLAQ